MINNRYGSQVNMPLLAALIIIIISFSSLWVTWLKIEAKAYGNSVDETLDFTDIMDADEEFTQYSDKLENSGMDSSELISKSEYDTMKNSFYTMKYAGLVGYILLGIAGVCLFISRKAMTAASLLSAVAFIVSIIGALQYCSKTEKYMDDFSRKVLQGLITIRYDLSIDKGIIIPLICAIAVTVIGFMAGRKQSYQEY